MGHLNVTDLKMPLRLLLASALLTSPSAFAAVDIGVAAAVRGKVNGAAPGSAGRVVETGKPVYQNDKITTGPDAKLQILLLDETSFTVGPNSEMILDEFVYDPATNVGKVSARVQKGNFRFITGKVARKDPDSMKVKLPMGTIGIRGTMVAGKTDDKDATVVLLGPGLDNDADEKGGAITVGNEKGSTEVDQDGWGVNMKAGEAPGDPFQLPQGQLDGILSGVASTPRGDTSESAGGSAGEGSTASEGSGGDTSAGKGNLSDAFAALDSEQQDTSTFAAQQFSAPHRTTWDDVRGIVSGTAQYNGSGVYYDCFGGSCGTNSVGTATMMLHIDFGNRTVGGSGSSITMSGAHSATGSINALSYASLQGSAQGTATMSPAVGIGTWQNANIELLDVGGVTAGAAAVKFRITNSSPALDYQGEVSGSR